MWKAAISLYIMKISFGDIMSVRSENNVDAAGEEENSSAETARRRSGYSIVIFQFITFRVSTRQVYDYEEFTLAKAMRDAEESEPPHE